MSKDTLTLVLHPRYSYLGAFITYDILCTLVRYFSSWQRGSVVAYSPMVVRQCALFSTAILHDLARQRVLRPCGLSLSLKIVERYRFKLSQPRIVDRFGNRTLEQYLRSFINYQQDDWVDFLHMVEFAYNNSIYSSMGYTTVFANMGYHPCCITL